MIKNTVRKANRLYVRKTVKIDGKRRQIWRVCEPPTATRAKEILTEIEAEILSGDDRNSVEIAKIFLKVQRRELKFSEFKNKVEMVAEHAGN